MNLKHSLRLLVGFFAAAAVMILGFIDVIFLHADAHQAMSNADTNNTFAEVLEMTGLFLFIIFSYDLALKLFPRCTIIAFVALICIFILIPGSNMGVIGWIVVSTIFAPLASVTVFCIPYFLYYVFIAK